MTLPDRIKKLAHPTILLLVVAVLAYGLLLPHMGFYWDELPMSWIRYELGPEAMTRYFSTNRPAWGMLYQLTTRFLPQTPIYWQVFGLIWRWVAAILVWGIARNIMPTNRHFALVASLCFLIYPGFNQQWTSYLYSHFFIVLCFLLLSFLFMIWSVRSARWYWPLTLAALLLSALNLWMLEYFFVLELFRPILLYRIISLSGNQQYLSRSVKRTLVLWSPYVVVFVSNVFWRLFVFNNQVYQPTLIPSLQAQPFSTLLDLVGTIGVQFYTVSLSAWSQIFHLPELAKAGPRTVAFYIVVVVITAFVVAVFFRMADMRANNDPPQGWWPLGLGLVAIVTAGGPFWLTGLEVSLAYPANRFTLPFMLGVSLVLASLLVMIPSAVRVWLLVALIGLAAGRQALWADSYRQDWVTQKSMFRQMLWRAPGIAPNTIVMLNEGALPYYADNSLTGALNWIYDPDNRSRNMDYVLFYPTSRLGGTLATLEAGQTVTYDFISEVFSGNTSQTLAFYYQPPGCLRLLDPLIDSENRLIPDSTLMRDAARLSSTDWIRSDATGKMPNIYGPEPNHGWCFHFEQAELAAQSGNWQLVTELGDKAFRLDDYPNDPVERFVFIEGYAHTGDWERALELSDTSYQVSRNYVEPLLCRLWERISANTVSTLDRDAALSEVKNMFVCSG